MMSVFIGSAADDDDGDYAEATPLLLAAGDRCRSRRSTSAPHPSTPVRHRGVSSVSLLVPDCWLLVISYIVPVLELPSIKNPLCIDDVQRILCLAHIDRVIRTCAVHTVVGRAIGPGVEAAGAKDMLCIAVSDTDQEHAELAEHCLMRPCRVRAARTLARDAREASTAAVQLLNQVGVFVYLALLAPTLLTLVFIVKPTWKLWTVSIAAVVYVPLFYLGFLVSRATLRWWVAINPVDLCPHVNRSAAAHFLHPSPWLRVAVSTLLSTAVGMLLLFASYRLGEWMDMFSTEQTWYILIFLFMIAYMP